MCNRYLQVALAMFGVSLAIGLYRILSRDRLHAEAHRWDSAGWQRHVYHLVKLPEELHVMP